MVKAIAVVRTDMPEGTRGFALILLRGDHALNEIKAQKTLGDFRFAHDDEIVEALGANLAISARWQSATFRCSRTAVSL